MSENTDNRTEKAEDVDFSEENISKLSEEIQKLSTCNEVLVAACWEAIEECVTRGVLHNYHLNGGRTTLKCIDALRNALFESAQLTLQNVTLTVKNQVTKDLIKVQSE